MTPALSIERLRVGYGPRDVLSGFDLALEAGRIGCLLGASGCGKTTVLRAVAGLEPVRGGRIVLQGVDVTQVPAERRRVGLMFQDHALFPHLDAQANIGFGLRALPRQARRARVDALLERVGLAHAHAAYPHELSGGQQQRVALARALAPEPRVLLLDEPFSSLDAALRQRLLGDVRSLLADAGTTVLMVTHDAAEAFALADRIGVMAGGALQQWDSPQAVHARPATAAVAEVLGQGQWVNAALLGHGAGRVFVRHGELAMTESDGIAGCVEQSRFLGPGYRMQVRLDDGTQLDVDGPAAVPAGTMVSLRPTDDLGARVFDAAG